MSLATPIAIRSLQRKLYSKARKIKLFSLLLIVVAVVGVLIWQGYGAEWTGFGNYTGPVVDKSQTFTRAKTLWDWLQLLIIPVALALGVFVLNREDGKRKLALAAEDAREEALTSYFDTIAKLLLESGLRTSNPDDEVRAVARAYTLVVLRRLDGLRKGIVIQFLSSAKLITKPNFETTDRCNPIIKLDGADFSGVYFEVFSGAGDIKVDLSNTYLQAVNFRKADLSAIDLSDALLAEADLRGADCRCSSCQNTDFSSALVDRTTDFRGAVGDFAIWRKPNVPKPILDEETLLQALEKSGW